MTEAFNKMLGTHRTQTYLQLLEFIRCIVMKKLQQRKEECDAWRNVLPLRVNAKIVKNSFDEKKVDKTLDKKNGYKTFMVKN